MERKEWRMNGGWSLPENAFPVTRRGSSNVNSVMSLKCFWGLGTLHRLPGKNGRALGSVCTLCWAVRGAFLKLLQMKKWWGLKITMAPPCFCHCIKFGLSGRHESERTGVFRDTNSQAENPGPREPSGASLRDMANAGVCPLEHKQPEPVPPNSQRFVS